MHLHAIVLNFVSTKVSHFVAAQQVVQMEGQLNLGGGTGFIYKVFQV